MKVLITKAGALYELCEFEHALKFFTRAHLLAPESKLAKDGALKCRKTIMNKLENQNLFKFEGSEEIIDFLRKKTEAGTGRSKNVLEPPTHLRKQGENRKGNKQGQSAQNRMKVDRDFLKSLQQSISSPPFNDESSIR